MVNQVKQASGNTVEFAKRLLSVVMALIAMLPIVTGIYTIWYGHMHITGVPGDLILFAGASAACLGLVGLYKLLMR
jgi:hypothetical protein